LNIFDFNDFYPEGASLYYENRIIKRSIRSIGNSLLHLNLRSADLVTTVSLPMYHYALRNGAKNVEIIPNGVDTELFKPNLDVTLLRENLKLGGNVIGFVGTIERWFELHTLIHAFQKIVKEVPDAQFLIIGGSIKTDYSITIRDLIKKLNLERNIIMTGTIPYREVPSHINLMKVALIPPIQAKLFMGEIALPNKFFQYLACDKIVLSTPYPEIMRLGKEAIVPYNSMNEFVDRSIEILKSDVENNPLGLKLAKQYDWSKHAEKLERIINKYS
jgi:glycosyltransferase involved in cell wall biosynthesis